MLSTFPFEEVEKLLGASFQDKELLRLAFTHRSYWHENQDEVPDYNQRLEFLGDSVLGLIVGEHLYKQHPSHDEGFLSSLRSMLVDAPACVGYVQELEVEPFLLLGRGEKLNRGKGRESILADLFEAIVGALYLDQGLAATRDFFLTRFAKTIEKMVAEPVRNWKAELQDYTQRKFQMPPEYRVEKEWGAAHNRQFLVGVWIDEEKLGEGIGFSKKEAQFEAAASALMEIEGR
ncbi:MAG: Ribonuclease 3 [Chlamydiae bacterium]|nr:Ribonuclease 3 [Chlamydiota bacterium]